MSERLPARSPTVIDLFAGPGGWDEGARDLGIVPDGSRSAGIPAIRARSAA